MNRDQAISRIKSIEARLRALGAAGLYLFGSTSRNEAKPTSDIDIFIDRDPSKKCGFIELLDMEELLQTTLNSPVDLATRSALHPALRDEIERTAIRVL